jgi:hypothetical protein
LVALSIGAVGENRLDVDDRRTIDRSDPQPGSGDLAHGHAMQPQRVRPVRRPCGEHAGERDLSVTARVHFEHVAIRTMKPGDNDDLVARSDPE